MSKDIVPQAPEGKARKPRPIPPEDVRLRVMGHRLLGLYREWQDASAEKDGRRSA